MKITFDLMNKVLPVALSKRLQQPKKLPADPVDEIRRDDLQAFLEKMGKWSRDSITGTHDPIFRWLVKVSRKLRGPLDHFYWSMLKATKPNEPTRFSLMVWGEDDKIANKILAQVND